MHASRLAGFIVDCQAADLQRAAEFWGAALNMELQPLPGDDESKYIRLVDPEARLHVEVQSVAHPSRVHLDIEADDVAAEVERLEGLGARRVESVHTWWVMEAPTGQRFCVVPRHAGVIDRWHALMRARDMSGLDNLLAEGVVFESPALHTPQRGRALTRKYLEAANLVLNNDTFRYVGEWRRAQSAVLEFTCRLGDIEVDGVDMIDWSDPGQITRFKVMVRPLKALQALMPLMAAELART